MKKRDFILVSMVIAIALGIFSKFTGTICIVRGITGIPCPGCGMTRAYKAILNGDIKQAFVYHPLFLLPIILVFIYFVKNSYFNKSVLIIGVIFISVYIFRMLSLFPNVYPMEYNNRALIPKVFQEVRYICTKNYYY